MTDEKTPEVPPAAAPVKAVEVAPATVGGRLATFFMWVKVIVLVVLLVLLVILVIQNFKLESQFIIIVQPAKTVPTVLLVLASFGAGVLMTLLSIFLRRSSRKRA